MEAFVIVSRLTRILQLIKKQAILSCYKRICSLLVVRISSYVCTWEVWRALKKLEFLSAAPQATLTHLSYSPKFLRASITRYTHAKHEQILNLS